MNKKEGHKFSNRLMYTLIALGIIAVLSVGVYASLNPTIPNPGHPVSELQKCSGSEILKMNSAGTAWECVAGGTSGAIDGSEDSRLIFSQSDQAHSGLGNIAGYAAIENDGGTYNALMILGRSQSAGGIRIVKLWDYLQVNGDLAVTNSITAGAFFYGSDKALKTNIQPLTNSLDKVQQLQGVSFDWKSNGQKNIGLIAQDVEKVLPELVSEQGEYKSVAYGNIVALLIEAVKEQQKQIDELKSQLQEMKEN